MRLCTKCLIPESAEGFQVNAEGECAGCQNIYAKKNVIDWAERRILLDELVAQYKGIGTYDCIVPFSGGKDSTYQLYFIMNELNLKPLVIRYDHWGYRPHMDKNNWRVFQSLGCDVIEFKANWHVVKQLMLQGLALRGDFCWHCHTGIYAYVTQLALLHKVNLIFWGEAPWEYNQFSSAEELSDMEEGIFDVLCSQGVSLQDIIDESKGQLTLRDLAPFAFPSKEEIGEAGLRAVYLGNYIPWDIRKHVKIISEELGWEGARVEGIPEEWFYEKIECKWQGIRDWCKFIKRGFGRTAHLVSLDVRNGTMTRDEALKLVKENDGKRPASLDIFLDVLGITEEEFLNYLALHEVKPWSFKKYSAPQGDPLPDMADWEENL